MNSDVVVTTQRPRIGLALGSGGSRGLAHIGAIRVLEKAGIPIDVITGSSIGAWVGALYATTKSADRLMEVALSKDWRSMASVFFDITSHGGLIKGDKMASVLKQSLRKKTFADCQVPLGIVMTEFKTGLTEYCTKGDLVTAIRASMAVPFVFSPVSMRRKLFLDGGLAEPVPVMAARSLGADFVIAINLDGDHLLERKGATHNPFSVLSQSLQIVRFNLARTNSEDADVTVEPWTKVSGIAGIGWAGFLRPERIIKAGERAMRKELPKIKALLKM